jgi:hypothetical protein
MDNNTSLFSDPFTTSARDRLHYEGATIVSGAVALMSFLVNGKFLIFFMTSFKSLFHFASYRILRMNHFSVDLNTVLLHFLSYYFLLMM